MIALTVVALVAVFGLLLVFGLARAAGKPRPRPPVDPDLQWLVDLNAEHRADRERREVEQERGGPA